MPNLTALDSTSRRTNSCADEDRREPTTPRADGGRAERLAASGRYDAFAGRGVSAVPIPGRDPAGLDCTRPEDYLHFDYDRCETVDVEDPMLFRQQAGTADAVDRSDITQGKMGDCPLMATLASLAGTPDGRAFIKNMVTESTSDRGEPVYTVTLHTPASKWLGPKTFAEVKVTVDAHFATGHAEPAEPFASGQEIWPVVIEKAYAQLCGGYNAIARGGCPADAMEALTGKEAKRINLRWSTSYAPERLERDCAAGKLVVLETRPDIEASGAYGLVGGHAYSVVGTEVRDGRLCAKLYNPWNESQPGPIPCDELNKWFSRVDVGSVR